MGKYSDLLLTADEPTAQAGAGKYSAELLGDEPQAPAAQPQKEGWGDWIKNSIVGRRDPKEAGTRTVFEQFPQELGNPTASAANFGASDAQMGDVVQNALGSKFVRREKDANSYDVFVTQGQDGQEQRGYLNAPGLDMQDVSRGIRGALPYIATGGALGAGLKGAGRGVQAIAQGLGAGATSVAGDVAQIPLGSEQGVELGKAATMTGFGAAGPAAGAAAGALWRKFVTIPGLIDDATGQLTIKGIEAARRAGIDPADITPDFAKGFANELATTGNPAQAATKAGVDRFGIPATRGQVTKDPYLLTQEEGMRRRLYGESAQDTMRGFDSRQSEAVRFAALGDNGSGGSGTGAFAPKKGIAEQLAPDRQPGASVYDRTPTSLGENIQSGLVSARQGAKTLERDAWSKATALEATPEALAELPAKVNAALGGRMPNARATPAAFDMAQEMQRILKGEAPEKAADFLASSPTRNVDEMRRNLLSISKGAQTDADRSLAGSMYDAFNDWIGESASKKLLSGDPQAAMALVQARGFTKEVRDLFQPSLPNGRATPAASRLTKIKDVDSGEGVIEALFGSQGSRKPSDGAVQTLTNFKAALDKYAPQVAEQTWNDVRLAHWTRLVTDKTGELVGPTAMLTNIKSSMAGQRSVFEKLYNPAEQRQIKEFVRALQIISFKPPNASGSGYSAATFAKEGITRLLDAFGLGKIGGALVQYTGVGSALNSAAAKQAVRQFGRPVRPNITPAVTGVGQEYARD